MTSMSGCLAVGMTSMSGCLAVGMTSMSGCLAGTGVIAKGGNDDARERTEVALQTEVE